MNENNTELEQKIKENLKVERLVLISVEINGKEYSQVIAEERLLKVYERIMKGEQIFTIKIPKNAIESLKEKILAAGAGKFLQ
jgi:hypothetical protein